MRIDGSGERSGLAYSLEIEPVDCEVKVCWSRYGTLAQRCGLGREPAGCAKLYYGERTHVIYIPSTVWTTERAAESNPDGLCCLSWRCAYHHADTTSGSWPIDTPRIIRPNFQTPSSHPTIPPSQTTPQRPMDQARRCERTLYTSLIGFDAN
jgi:hypothetical protein